MFMVWSQYYRDWVPTSLASYEQSYDLLQREDQEQEQGEDRRRRGEAGRSEGAGGKQRRQHQQQGQLDLAKVKNKPRPTFLQPLLGTLVSAKQKQGRPEKKPAVPRKKAESERKFPKSGQPSKKSKLDISLKQGAAPPLPPSPPRVELVAPPPPLDHMEPPASRPQQTTTRQPPAPASGLSDPGHVTPDKDADFDLSIANHKFSVNPIVTFHDEAELVQQIQKTITPDRLPGVAQVAPNPAPLYSPVPATKAAKAAKAAQAAKVAKAAQAVQAAKVPTSSRPRYVNLGHQYAPAPAPELGTSYSEDQIFREEEKNLEDESLVRRQAFLGPQIPILRNIMDFNFPSYNFE